MRSDSKHREGGGTVRIVGGRWRRTVLSVLDEPGLRPTPGRIRETLFNWLAHAYGDLEGRSVLDLFAGSGALGFEAASRGANPVVLVEANTRVLDVLRATQARLAATEVEIIAGDALRTVDRLRHGGRQFDVVFLDPPFGQGMMEKVLPSISPLLCPQGFVYVESDQRLTEADVQSSSLTIYRSDKAGGVFYHLLQRKKID